MEASTKSNVSQAMMLALTKSYNAYMIFKKCQVDVAILIDPTHTREEFEESITTKMDLHLSHNAVSNVLLPPAFIAQDYSTQIANLRDKRKADLLVKPDRKAKRAAVDGEAGNDERIPGHTTSGKKLFFRKNKLAVKFVGGDSDSDSDDKPINRCKVTKGENEVCDTSASGTLNNKDVDGGNSSCDDSGNDCSSEVHVDCTPDTPLLHVQAV
jgi:hypothetical protein